MELDKRIKNNHRPLCVIDIKWAMGFIGQNGFFADAINCFENLSECESGKLVSAEDNKIHPFECDNEWTYSFFLPEEWVESPEVKYEPYTLCTWEQDFKFGDELLIRIKDEESDYMYKGIYNGWSCKDRKIVISIGTWLFTLDEFFKLYEIYKNGQWEPIGKKIEE